MDSVFAVTRLIAGKAMPTPKVLLAHLENVGQLLDEALKMVELIRLEIHGPKEELAKLREPLAKLNPQFFTLEYGFRR